MFDEYREGLKSFAQVARELRVHVSTLHRWSTSGVRGRTLRTRLVGGRRYVDLDQLKIFLAAESCSLTGQSDNERKRRAQDVLDSFGIARRANKTAES